MPNAELKAKELVDKFHAIISNGNDVSPEFEIVFGYKKNAKESALIAVEEIQKVVILAYLKLGCGEIGELKHYIPYIYWKEVKEEILKQQ